MGKLEHTEQFLEESIRQGRWSDTNRLPPERELADMLGISRGTLRLALRALSSRGVLDTRRGSGSVITSDRGGHPGRLHAFGFFFPHFVGEHAKHGLPDKRLMEFYSLLSQFGAALKNWDKKRFMVNQPKFFLLLIRMSQDAVIQSAMRETLPEMAFWMNFQKKVSPTQCKMLFLMECDIVDAIREQDGGSAGASMRRFTEMLTRLDAGEPENGTRSETDQQTK